MRISTAKLPDSLPALHSGHASLRFSPPETYQDVGCIHSAKDRTNEQGIDPVTDAPADDTGRRGMDESRHDGKHVDSQEQAPACSSRGLDPCLIRSRPVRSRKQGGVGSGS